MEAGAAGGQGDGAQEAWGRAADWVWDFCAAGYGPRGGLKLMLAADGQAALLRSPATALRDAAADPALTPYVRLATDLQEHGRDQATFGLLLAAGLVRHSLRAAQEVAMPQVLDGLALARRQAKATVASLASPALPLHLLAGVGNLEGARAILGGIAAMGQASPGQLALDDVEVLVEGDAWSWLQGVRLKPAANLAAARSSRPTRGARASADPSARAPRQVRVALADSALRKSADGALLRLRAPQTAGPDRVRDAAERLHDLGVGLVGLSGSAPDGLADHLAERGILLCANLGETGLARVASLSGAQVEPTLASIVPAGLGTGTVAWSAEAWELTGQGPGWTLVAPGGTATAASLAREEAERMLGALAIILADPRGLPGGGRWQRTVAAGLLAAADVAPRRAPYGVRAAANAFADVADLLPGPDAHEALPGPLVDSAVLAGRSVAAAFDCAAGILRVDAVWSRRPSSQGALRGGQGRVGPGSGIATDTPPLM